VRRAHDPDLNAIGGILIALLLAGCCGVILLFVHP
jgi:hypothetical protein